MKKTVSVIIPVYNASAYLGEVLDVLLSQDYTGGKIEVIVVDNGSTDDTPGLVKRYSDFVTLLFETNQQGPYAARNRGLEHASGDIIALIDANKRPARNWVRAGVECLEREQADLAGGEILFDLGDHPSVAEIYDAVTFNDNRRFVEQQQGAAAGNLFFRREVLEKNGGFPGNFRSGMDIWWTQNAVRNGHKLVFAGNAKVWCKPRSFRGVLRKSFRVGTAHPFNQMHEGQSAGQILGTVVRTFAPPKMRPLKQKLQSLGIGHRPLVRVWMVAWMSKICMGIGRSRGLFRLGF